MGGRSREGFRWPNIVRAIVALVVIVAVPGCFRATRGGEGDAVGAAHPATGDFRDTGTAAAGTEGGTERLGADAAETGDAAGPAEPSPRDGAGRAPSPGPGTDAGEAAPAPGELEKRDVPAPESAGTRPKAGRPRADASRRNGTLPSAEPKGAARAAEDPVWAKSREDLVYRVRFLGVTAGFARFSYLGRASVEGKETHHIRVRAWTTSVLAIVYPVNDTMDYYVDVHTLAPVRQDFQKRERNKERDEITIFDQAKGTITTRLKNTGEIRKKVEVPPGVHDPVTMVYNFRAQNDWRDDQFSNVYAGRKLWQISARKLGLETLKTGRGPVETVLLQPVIRQNGKIQDKGTLRMWMTNDQWRIPVRIFAKIKFGTLVGDLDMGEGRVSYAGR